MGELGINLTRPIRWWDKGRLQSARWEPFTLLPTQGEPQPLTRRIGLKFVSRSKPRSLHARVKGHGTTTQKTNPQSLFEHPRRVLPRGNVQAILTARPPIPQVAPDETKRCIPILTAEQAPYSKHPSMGRNNCREDNQEAKAINQVPHIQPFSGGVNNPFGFNRRVTHTG
jgi:hypothetical protein